MANEQQQTQPQVAIPLPKGKKNAVPANNGRCMGW